MLSCFTYAGRSGSAPRRNRRRDTVRSWFHGLFRRTTIQDEEQGPSSNASILPYRDHQRPATYGTFSDVVYGHQVLTQSNTERYTDPDVQHPEDPNVHLAAIKELFPSIGVDKYQPLVPEAASTTAVSTTAVGQQTPTESLVSQGTSATAVGQHTPTESSVYPTRVFVSEAAYTTASGQHTPTVSSVYSRSASASASPPPGYIFTGFTGLYCQPSEAPVFEGRRIEKAVPESFASQYALISPLKRINMSPLSIVRSLATNEKLIMKQMSYRILSDGTMLDPVEADVMKQIKHEHPNIIRIPGHIDDKENDIYNMAIELCSGGGCHNIISACQRRGERIPAPIILLVASCMIDALAFIHNGDIAYDSETGRTCQWISEQQQPRILHRDIKPENIFLRWSEESLYGLPEAVLADFGLATIETNSRGNPGTLNYMPPECFDKDIKYPWTREGDMYSLGCTLFELMAGYRYKRYDKDGDLFPLPDIEEEYMKSTVRGHSEIYNMIELCLAEDPSDRPKVQHLHIYSALFKQKLHDWHANGGEIAGEFWPETFENDKPLPWQQQEQQQQQQKQALATGKDTAIASSAALASSKTMVESALATPDLGSTVSSFHSVDAVINDISRALRRQGGIYEPGDVDVAASADAPAAPSSPFISNPEDEDRTWVASALAKMREDTERFDESRAAAARQQTLDTLEGVNAMRAALVSTMSWN